MALVKFFLYKSIPALQVVELVLADLSADYPDMLSVVLTSPIYLVDNTICFVNFVLFIDIFVLLSGVVEIR